jgi:hypothetical protein
MPVAVKTTKREVLSDRVAAVLSCDYMVDLER